MTTAASLKFIQLTEQTTHQHIHLTTEQVRSLNELTMVIDRDDGPKRVAVITLAPESSPGSYAVRTGSIVGAVSVPGLTINISPKAGIGKTAYMLAHSLGLARWLPPDAFFSDMTTLVLALIPPMLGEIESIVKHGLVEEYLTVADRGVRPRGSMNFANLARSGLPLPLDYEFDDLRMDTPANQLLRAALERVAEMPAAGSELRTRARGNLLAFTDVSFVTMPQLNQVCADPRKLHYRNALALASLLLRGLGLETEHGIQRSQSLLFDMNRVFEHYVSARLQQSQPADLYVDTQGQVRHLYLDAERRFRLRPDFGFWKGSRCLVTGDIKYKILGPTSGVRSSDLYQVVAYAAATRARTALLLYVGRYPATWIEVTNPDVRVLVGGLDLEMSISELEAALSEFVAVALTDSARSNTSEAPKSVGSEFDTR